MARARAPATTLASSLIERVVPALFSQRTRKKDGAPGTLFILAFLYWKINGPIFVAGELFQVGVGVDGKASFGLGQHIGVPLGVAEGGVGSTADDIAESLGLAGAARDADEAVEDDSFLDENFSGEDAFGRDTEVADAFPDDPLIAGRDGPDFASPIMEPTDQLEHSGEKIGNDVLGDELFGGCFEFRVGEACVQGNHFSAHGVFIDKAFAVVSVAGADVLGNLFGDEAALDLPAEETFSGISAPECAVAVEGGELGIAAENVVEEGVVLGAKEHA